MKTKKGRWFRLIRIREIEIENQKRRGRWRRTEALNRRSILSKRKRRPDLLTPPASSLFHRSLRRRVFANRKVAAFKRELLSSPNPRRIVPILARYGLQLIDEMDRF
ncbi:BnaC01g20900D [Brassica napus]|uniref:BnaC01g20900D protein n=1 Tax=Brassica napus TaxID=3708 RepID=A0A078G2V0_BRANA|nr:BnaC01g20900D [Brassica napus]